MTNSKQSLPTSLKGQDLVARGLAVLTTDTQSRFDRVDRNIHQLREELAEVKQQGIQNADSIDGLQERLNQSDRKIETEIGSLCGEMLRRFEQVDARFEQVDARFDAIDKRFDGLEQRFNDKIDSKIDGLRTEMNHKFDVIIKLLQQ